MTSCRQEIWLSGTVQGVGFRYTVLRLSSGFDITGYVQNLADGRVYLVVEGTDQQIQTLVEQVRQAMGDLIAAVKIDTAPATGEFSGFEIRH